MASSYTLVRNTSYMSATGVLDLALSSFTLCAWIYPTSAGGVYAYQGILCQNGSANPLFGIHDVSSNGKIAIFSGGVWLDGATLSNNTWQFVAATFDGGSGSGTARIYSGTTPANLSQDNSKTDNYVHGADTSLSIGLYRSGDISSFAGDMCYAHVYNRALSLSELKEVMARPGKIRNGLQVFYPMVYNSPETDTSDNKNDASATGSPSASANGPPVTFIGG